VKLSHEKLFSFSSFEEKKSKSFSRKTKSRMATIVSSSMLQPRSSIIKTEIVEVKKEIVEGKKEESDEPEVDIVINNVVCSFNVRCHLNLRDIALRGLNVEYRRENGVRKPTMYFELYY